MQIRSDFLWIVIAGLLSFWTLTAILALILIANEESGKAAAFGEFFGGLNTFVSILGFTAIVYTIQKGREDGEEERQRNIQNLRLQGEMLEAQRNVATSQDRHTQIVTIAANIEAHSNIHRNALADKQDNQRFLCDYGGTLIDMRRDQLKTTFDRWIDGRMNTEEKDAFCFASVPICGNINLTGYAADEAASIRDKWEKLGTSIKKEAQVAHEFKSYYIHQIIEQGDPKILQQVAQKFTSTDSSRTN
jgi:hypothetical protein